MKRIKLFYGLNIADCEREVNEFIKSLKGCEIISISHASAFSPGQGIGNTFCIFYKDHNEE